jgi:hypothetical protein
MSKVRYNTVADAAKRTPRFAKRRKAVVTVLSFIFRRFAGAVWLRVGPSADFFAEFARGGSPASLRRCR